MIEVLIIDLPPKRYFDNTKISFSNGKMVIDDGTNVEIHNVENVIKIISYC